MIRINGRGFRALRAPASVGLLAIGLAASSMLAAFAQKTGPSFQGLGQIPGASAATGGTAALGISGDGNVIVGYG